MRSVMQDMFGSLSLIMNLLTALAAQMLLATFAEHSFDLVRRLLAFLAQKLDFVLVRPVAEVAARAAYLLAGHAPERALRLLFAVLTYYCHFYCPFHPIL